MEKSTVTVTYSIIPHLDKSVSLHLQLVRDIAASGRYWKHLGGLGSDFTSDAPWWFSGKDKSSYEPNHLSEEKARALLKLIDESAVTPSCDSALGCDGTSYELEISSGFSSIKFNWWCDLPTAWDSLNPLISNLDEIIKERA